MASPGAIPSAALEKKKDSPLSISTSALGPSSGSPIKPVRLHFTDPADVLTDPADVELKTPPGGPPSTRSLTGPTVQDYIGDMQPAGPNGTIVKINANNVSLKFFSLMKEIYPTGFTVEDGKVWRNPVALISESNQITKLGPVYIGNNPYDAMISTAQTFTDRNKWNKTAIAMQYCIEKSAFGNHTQLEDYIKEPAKLLEVFTKSAKQEFAFNRNYKVELVSS